MEYTGTSPAMSGGDSTEKKREQAPQRLSPERHEVTGESSNCAGKA